MRQFDEIFDISAERKGGADALEKMLSKPLSPEELARIPEDRWLSQMTKCIFQSGFNWKVVEAKWDGFEDAFHGFDPARNAMMSGEELDALIGNKAIIRNGAKIETVRNNAAFILSLREQGGVGKVLGEWPATDYIGVLDMLKARGSRLGAATGQYALRFMGRDGFILSRDVTARLIAESVIDKPATSKTAMKSVQSAFNTWMEQSGRSLTEISRVLAMSV